MSLEPIFVTDHDSALERRGQSDGVDVMEEQANLLSMFQPW